MPDDVEENGGEVSDAMSENEHEYDDTEDNIKDDDDRMGEQHASSDNGNDGTGEVKKKYDPKDPTRPRRKKARRACYACQRAHLTCGKFRASCLSSMVVDEALPASLFTVVSYFWEKGGSGWDG